MSATHPQRIEDLERSVKALELRKAGLTYAAIATKLGYASPGAAANAILNRMKDVVEEPAKQVRDLEIARLDDMLLSIWGEVRKGHLGAHDRALRIMERRAKLLGLDAPTKIDFDDAPMPVMVNVQVIDGRKKDEVPDDSDQPEA